MRVMQLQFILMVFMALPYLATLTSAASAESKSFPLTRDCEIEEGNEINEDDDSCETFYRCRDYVGKLSKCPGWWQFHHEDLVCRNNSEVWCQYQMLLLEEAAQREEKEEEEGETAKQKAANKKVPTEKESEYDDEYDKNYDENYNYKGTGTDDGAYDYDYDDEYDYGEKPSFDYPGLDDGDYECETEYGHEPNLGDMTCASFWRCDEYIGSLISCANGLQYDYRTRACMDNSEVSCRGQMSAFMHKSGSRPARKVQKVQKPKRKGGKGKKDGKGKEDDGLTIVHHFYHGNAKPKVNPKGKDFQEGSRVRHVFVNKKRADAITEPISSKNGKH